MSSPKIWLLFGVFLFSMGCSSRNRSVKFDDGNYVGSLDKNGERDGEGTFTWNNGDKYVGKYQNGKRHGKGTFTWNNGDKYDGEYLNGKRHGKGKYTWGDGTHYFGEYVDGKRQGDGIFTNLKSDDPHRKGKWNDDVFVEEAPKPTHNQSSNGKAEGDSTDQLSIPEKPSPDFPTTAPSPDPETSPEVQPQPVEIIIPPTKEELPPLPGEPIEIEPPPPPSVELPPLPGEPIEIAPPSPETKENVATWTGTQEEAENYLESRDRGEISALHVKETGKAFEGTIIIVLEDGSKQGQVTVVDGLLHGEEILWGEGGEILERNRYENGKLVSEEITPKKE